MTDWPGECDYLVVGGGAADDSLAVLTPRLRLRGIDELRVADASVFPDKVTVNICNTVMLVAERAAELIAPRRSQQAYRIDSIVARWR